MQYNIYESYRLNIHLFLFIQYYGLHAAATRHLYAQLGLTNFALPYGNFGNMEEMITLDKNIIIQKIINSIGRSGNVYVPN